MTPRRHLLSFIIIPLVVGFGMAPKTVLACAVCYGQSDSPMAAGMNWGIFCLLGVIISVLGGVAAFFVFLARRSASLSGVDSGLAELPVQAAFDAPSQSAHHRPSHKTGRPRSTSVFATRPKDCAHSGPRAGRRDFLVRTRN